LGAGLALVGGVALEDVGVAAMAIGAAAIALLPVLWITRRGRRDEPALASMIDR
jgi:predicted MFS family arabinose efflux permease